MRTLHPHREAARLAALKSYDVLDTPRERDFDEVAELASEICKTPIAVVNLIAEGRQFFKAEVGLGVRETALESSFCARAIFEEELLVIPDATRDARFDCNPLVTGEPHLRFYAGALLKTDEGHAIGTVCVLDYEPRDLTETQVKTLRVLARQVMKQLELRRTLREQTLAQEAGRIGTFEVDVATDIVTVSAESCRLYGMPIAPTYSAATLEALVLSEDRSVRSDVASRLDGSATLDVEYRVRRAEDGQLRWLARRASFLRDATGTVSRMFGTIHDVTIRRRLQEQQAALLDLGDRLRTARTSAEIKDAASQVLGRTLGSSRAGYGRIDLKADLFEVERDWSTHGTASFAGRHDLSTFASTIDQLGRGETTVVANVKAASWLSTDMNSYEAIGTRALINVPLVENGQLIGLFYVHQTERRTWAKDEVDFAHGVADRTYAALGKAQAEADQRILNEELSHRLKNTLAMVQAIATQTLRSVPERAPVEAFERRIHALASAHDVLLRQSWSAAPLRDVLAAVLTNFESASRFDLSGPDVLLGSRATLSISLLVHELATNAVKYGSLSVPDGRVSLAWRLEGVEAELVLDWVESGGPPTHEPDRKGFGSRLIRLGLVGTGGVDLRYPLSGVSAEFRAPLAQVQSS